MALQTAAPSCADDSGDRYVDCGNGTVTDNNTGLVWLADASCLAATVDWFTAMDFAAGLSDKPAKSAVASHDCGLSDGSSPGEWRLPSAEEWEAMVAEALKCDPTITNDSGDECWDSNCVSAGACSFSGVEPDFYWSATSSVLSPSHALAVYLPDGTLILGNKLDPADVWPVRGGQ